jgi:DNA-binding MarR family transcriptional regulator
MLIDEAWPVITDLVCTISLKRSTLFIISGQNRVSLFTVANILVKILAMPVVAAKAAQILNPPSRGGAALRRLAQSVAPGLTEPDWVDVNLSLLGTHRPDLVFSGSHVTARIFRLRELFSKTLDNVHSQFHLKPRMFLLLAALYRVGPPYEMSPARLTLYLMWTSAGLSQLLDRMVRAGLIRRRRDPEYEGRVLVALTAKGERIVSEVAEAHCRAELRLVAALSEGERNTLVNLMRKLLIAVEGPQFPRENEVRKNVRPRARRSQK